MSTFTSDVEMGERYRDRHTGIEGVATSITFYETGCEHASLEYQKDGEVKYSHFDASRLEHVESGTQLTSPQPGGPAPAPPGRITGRRADMPSRPGPGRR